MSQEDMFASDNNNEEVVPLSLPNQSSQEVNSDFSEEEMDIQSSSVITHHSQSKNLSVG